MWLRFSIIVFLFYFFAVLQTSFLAHFNIFGITPNFILIFFFLLIFFSALGWENFFYAIIAGFFLDVSSHSYFGVSIILLLILAFSIKKALRILWHRSDKYSVLYFIPLFAAYFIAYNALLGLSLFNWIFIIAIMYNLSFALAGFYICLKINTR